jgi:hypothetical protein
VFKDLSTNEHHRNLRRCRSEAIQKSVPSGSNTPVTSPRLSPSIAAPQCRRQYSSNSIRVTSVSVGPSDFVKIRLLGKGDVGRVYLVKKKTNDRLYALKGM